MNGVRNQARPGLASRTATPGSAVFVAVGTGLQLAAPKVPTSFIVSSSNGSKLRVRRPHCARVQVEVSESMQQRQPAAR